LIAKDRAAGHKFTYLFDSYLHKPVADFLTFMNSSFGFPTFSIHCVCDKKTAEERYKKKNDTEEVPEDVLAEIEESSKKAERLRVEVEQTFSAGHGKIKFVSLDTNGSLEKL
jgi:hypothetical protein